MTVFQDWLELLQQPKNVLLSMFRVFHNLIRWAIVIALVGQDSTQAGPPGRSTQMSHFTATRLSLIPTC